MERMHPVVLIINNEPTHLDDKATWMIHDPIGKVLNKILAKVT